MTYQRSKTSQRNLWSHVEIRRARRIPLKPVLESLGYRLNPAKNDNYIVLDLPQDIIVKDHYWVCPETGSAGNSIDFLVKIKGLSFSKSMQLLLPAVSLPKWPNQS